MNTRLSDLQTLLQPGKTITEDDATIARHVIHETQHTLRRAGRQIGRTFTTLCEAFATLDMDTLPATLREQIEAVVLGRDLPETHATGPITPIEMLQLSQMIAAMGERELAARLRRLADSRVSKPDEPRVFIGWDHGAGDDMTAVSIATRRADGVFCVTTVETMVAACMPGSSAADTQAIADRVSEYFIGLAEGGAR